MASNVPRVQVVPLPDDQVAIIVDRREVLRWNAASRAPRPFFHTIGGPAGLSLVRIGHPDAPDHDHHRGLWWGHHDINGVNYWLERRDQPVQPHIRQLGWLHYQDGDEWAGLAVRIGWFDSQAVRVMTQEMIAVYRPLDQFEGWLEVQATFTSELPRLMLGKTNFGFLGLRVPPSMSERYGGGRLTSGEGAVGEPAIFGKPARWVDYSGPIRASIENGVTWFDHPSNPNHPTSWHVRADGWFSAAFNLREAGTLEKSKPLRLLYGFHLHHGMVNSNQAGERYIQFATQHPWLLGPGKPPWKKEIKRQG